MTRTRTLQPKLSNSSPKVVNVDSGLFHSENKMGEMNKYSEMTAVLKLHRKHGYRRTSTGHVQGKGQSHPNLRVHYPTHRGTVTERAPSFADALIGTASTLSGSRVVLRLCDDIPMLAYNLGYGWVDIVSSPSPPATRSEGFNSAIIQPNDLKFGMEEKDQFIRWVDVVKNMVDQFYGPVEHVMWATERQLLPGAYTEKLKEWCTKIWAISLTLNILRSLRALIILRLKKKRLAKTKQMEENDEADIKESMRTLRLQEFNVWLTLVGSSTDLVNAINWMPPGFLWAGKNPLALTGVMGMISSSIGLYRVYASKVKQA
ncbi:peroxisome fission [Branchiostoma belcheri]|nr:peroxisome fission [Branchiostoma belcheri]